MKKLVLIDVDEQRLKDIREITEETFDLNEAIRSEMGWIHESGIYPIEVMDFDERDLNMSEELSDSGDARLEELYDEKTDLIELVSKVIQDDFNNFGVDRDILHQLLRSCPYKSLIAYLSEDDQNEFLSNHSKPVNK